MAAPAPDDSTGDLLIGDQTVATCANSTNPICYNTAVSGSNIVAGLWFSSILGVLCLSLFIFFRTKFRLYSARLDMPQVEHKPPEMRTDGHYRLWSWLIPVFRVTDDELLETAGLDALVAMRILSFGIILLLPITVVGCAVLLPINFTDDWYQKSAQADNFEDEYTTVFIRLTMSNLTPGTPLMWVHFFLVILFVGWACWLITEQYKEYIALRQSYIVRCTELVVDQASGGDGGFREVLVARTFSPSKRHHQTASSSQALKLVPSSRTRTSTTGTTTNCDSLKSLIKLHRRDASMAAQDFAAKNNNLEMQQQALAAPQVTYYYPNNTDTFNHHTSNDSIPVAPSTTTTTTTKEKGGLSGGVVASRLGGGGGRNSAGASRSPSPLRKVVSAPANPLELELALFDGQNNQNQNSGNSGQHVHSPTSALKKPPLPAMEQLCEDTPLDDSHLQSNDLWNTSGHAASLSGASTSSGVAAAAAAAATARILEHIHNGSGGSGGGGRRFGSGGASGSGDVYKDWTMHDFSQDIGLDPHLLRSGSGIHNHHNNNGSYSNSPTSGAGGQSRSASQSMPVVVQGNTTNGTGGIGITGINPPQHQWSLPRSFYALATGGGGSTSISSELTRQHTTSGVVIRRQPSSAAVAAALADRDISSAAEALVKIRRHRNMSGGGGGTGGGQFSGRSTPMATPRGSASEGSSNVFNLLPTASDNIGSGSIISGGFMGNNSSGLGGGKVGVSVVIDTEGGDGGKEKTPRVPIKNWWSSVAIGGKSSTAVEPQFKEFRCEESITFQSSVLRADENGSIVAANASLYTVLVLDQPVERLRLGRSIGDDALGTQIRRKITNALSPKPMMNGGNFGLGQWGGGGQGGGELLPPADQQQQNGRITAVVVDDDDDDDDTSTHNNQLLRTNGTTNSSSNHLNGDIETGTLHQTLPHSTPPESAPLTTNYSTTIPPPPQTTTQRRNSSRMSIPSMLSETEELDEDSEGVMVTGEPGIFGHGWMATWAGLKQWWEHRGRYKEWRRDVRWAMFNKRVRTATEMFTHLFGEDFDSIIPIYPTQTVDKLLYQRDAAAAKLERLQHKLLTLETIQDEATITTTKKNKKFTLCGKQLLPLGSPTNNTDKVEKQKKSLEKSITKTETRLKELDIAISEERDVLLSDLPSTCFFATFCSQEAAAIAAQVNLNPINQRLFTVQPAPSPEDINWPALTRSWWQRQSRTLYVLPLILLIMLFPIGVFTGAFAQLTIAICGNPIDGSDGPASDTWFCSSDPWARFFRNLLTSLAPSILLSVYHMCILPVLVYYAAQAEGQCISLSQLDRRCADLFFYWDVFNVFLGAMLGGSVLSELSTYVQYPTQIWTTLSSAIPASSNFFINYVSYRALVMAWFRLFYPHMGIVTALFKWGHLASWAETPRDKAIELPVRNCRYGRDIGIPLMMNFVMVFAYAIVAPLILPFGLLYFVLLWPVWRYQMLYVYQRQYESGGQMWPSVAHKVVKCLYILVLFTGVVFIFKEAYIQAVLILIIMPIYLLRFDTYLKLRYDAVVEKMPLMAVHHAGRVESVDPALWTPPPLREGAQGWSPEWGKTWAWWGIPRYTL